jgi:hypothetical protein
MSGEAMVKSLTVLSTKVVPYFSWGSGSHCLRGFLLSLKSVSKK